LLSGAAYTSLEIFHSFKKYENPPLNSISMILVYPTPVAENRESIVSPPPIILASGPHAILGE
jgi:hypothetical protein